MGSHLPSAGAGLLFEHETNADAIPQTAAIHASATNVLARRPLPLLIMLSRIWTCPRPGAPICHMAGSEAATGRSVCAKGTLLPASPDRPEAARTGSSIPLDGVDYCMRSDFVEHISPCEHGN